jgi:hypothetical protein
MQRGQLLKESVQVFRLGKKSPNAKARTQTYLSAHLVIARHSKREAVAPRCYAPIPGASSLHTICSDISAYCGSFGLIYDELHAKMP